jgi:hypothetical protein
MFPVKLRKLPGIHGRHFQLKHLVIDALKWEKKSSYQRQKETFIQGCESASLQCGSGSDFSLPCGSCWILADFLILFSSSRPAGAAGQAGYPPTSRLPPSSRLPTNQPATPCIIHLWLFAVKCGSAQRVFV